MIEAGDARSKGRSPIIDGGDAVTRVTARRIENKAEVIDVDDAPPRENAAPTKEPAEPPSQRDEPIEIDDESIEIHDEPIDVDDGLPDIDDDRIEEPAEPTDQP